MLKILTIIIFSFIHAQDYPILGSSGTLDIITWNVEHYPKHNQTNSHLIEIINDINVDIIAFQEIEDNDAFNTLINNLNGGWVGYRSGGNSNYGELAYAINTDAINISSIYNILSQDEYYFGYRAPHVLEFSFQDVDYVMINNHFKCCGDGALDFNDSGDEEYRRLIASQLLQNYVENNYSLDKVIILGDLNDSITDIESNNVFWGFIESEGFQFADYDIAIGNSDNWSYPTWPSHLDHVIISSELYDIFDNEASSMETLMIDIDFYGNWNDYESQISDHRPILLILNH